MSGPGQTLFAFVRHWSRRWNGERPDRGRLVLVTEAAHSLGGGVTINALADEIGMDQSGASRLVKEAVAGGYLAMRAGTADARRREVSVTSAGEALLRDAHRWQEEVFGRLTERWTERQRDDFHRAMLRLLTSSRSI